jgi:uncharacterized repeat protein (TIGR02543 family)
MKTKLHLLVAFLLLTVTFISCDKEGSEPEMSYTVTFDPNGGAPTPQSQTVKAGENATAPATNPAKAGYVFMFWQLSGSSSAYNFGTPVNSNITLQARWEEEAKVEYWQVSWELNGGTWPAGDNHATQVVKGGTLAKPAAPTKAGDTFDGWYKEAALNTPINFPYDVSPVTANFTLYAKWTNGESGSTDPSGYKIHTSIPELKSWLANQSDNTAETPYKIGLKGVNLDEGNNWNDLGLAINGTKYIDLNLQDCTGTTIPDGRSEVSGSPPVVTIRYYGTFLNCDNLVAINFPAGLKTIGDYAFRGCDNLASVSLPQGFTNINRYAFEYCLKLASITLPEGLKKIGGSAFTSSGLVSITIPGSVNEWKWAFYKCPSLTSAIVGEGIETIETETFYDCQLLSSVILPAGLKTIADDAFYRCGFETITLPQGVTSIGKSAFENCKLTSITLPQGLTDIGEKAFMSSRQLSSISLSAGIKTIGKEAFNYCESLTSISIPEGIQSIGNRAFRYCTALVKVSLPNGLKVLSANMFESCESLQTITVPASVTSIENYVFDHCESLLEIIMLPTTPPTFTWTALSSTPAALRIKVPATSVSTYKTALNWRVYSDQIIANSN